jgi:TonB-dependent starch-binding outer membrane protein SusC
LQLIDSFLLYFTWICCLRSESEQLLFINPNQKNRMTKFYLSLNRYVTVLLILITTMAWSQSRTVTGKIVSSDDQSPLPGVNVVEKGTNNGTATDADGSYSINVGDNATLVFTFVGYATQEVAVGSQTTVNVTLESDVTALSEVVVIGYGEVNRRDATGAVASVKAEDFNRGIIASPEQLIQGKTAGVQITSSSGEPGAGVNLRIRGTSSVRGGNNPLFVVDGIPLAGDNVSAGGSDFGRGSQSAKNPLNFLNPNDIESIDILKDASATAIYGSRGANGVVIITTKSGKGKRHQLEYNATFSTSKQARYYDVLNADDFLDAYADTGGDPTLVDFGSDTNWQKEVSRTAFSHNHNLSYGDAFKSGNYRASLSYDNQQGIIRNSGMERYTGRLNFNKSFLNDKLNFGLQGLISKVNDEAAPITNTPGFEGDLIGTSLFYNPTIPATPTNLNGLTPDPVDQYPGDAANPLSLLKYYSDNTETSRQLINLSLDYDFTSNLNFKINTGYDHSGSERKSAMSGLQTKIGNVANNGRAFLNDQDNTNNLMEAFLTYKKNIGSNALTLLAGYSYQSFKIEGRNAAAANFGSTTAMATMISQLEAADAASRNFINQPWVQYEYQEDNRMRVYDLFAATPTVTEYTTGLPAIGPRGIVGSKYSNKNELQSYFARANYNIGEKYFFTASVRADGSTKFGANNKYGVFPSAAVKWRISEEDFGPDSFDDLAIRVGYGITGNQEIPHNLYTGRQRYGGVGINNDGTLGGTAGLTTVTFANPDLQWEQTAQLNVGLDFGFFDNRLSGTIDFYNKNTTQLLIQTISAQPAATDFFWENLDANVMNTGIELTLNAVLADRENFGFNVGFNFAYNENMVKNYAGSPLPTGTINGQGLSNSYAQRIANNQPLFSFYVRDWGGFDADGLNAGSDTQEFVGKSAIPKTNLGLSLSARYGDFDFAAYMYGQFGHYVYNNVANAFFTKGAIGAGRNVTADVVGSPESVGNSPDVSTRFLEKGNFLRMQNLSVGYSLKFGEGSAIEKLRFSLTGQNLFLITDYSGLDPEVNVDKNRDGVPSLGIDYTSYPRARTFSLGISATF